MNLSLRGTLLLLMLIVSYTLALTPNPLLSRNKPVYTSKGNADYLADNKFDGALWTVTSASWIAIKIEGSPSKVFLSWNDPNYAWTSRPIAPERCPNEGLAHLADYNILTSSNSTDGADGVWNRAAVITANPVTARGHQIDFTGASWIKIEIVAGSGSLTEIEVHDISNGAEDTWFFAGTSISANTFKSTQPAQNFADLITKKYPAYTPVTIRGGVACQSSSEFASNIRAYLTLAGNVHFWAIEHGTNDAWGGTNSNVPAFKANMQKVIDSCKAAGIEPIIARMIGTNSSAAGWQIHKDYLTCIDDLTKDNDLIAGPDLYTWFSTHPDDLNSDGVHPSASGAARIQMLWAEKVASLYEAVAVHQVPAALSSIGSPQLNITRVPGRLLLKPLCAGRLVVFTPDGSRIFESFVAPSGISVAFPVKGLMVVQFTTARGVNVQTVVNL